MTISPSPEYDLLYTELTGAVVLISRRMAFNRKQKLRDNIEALRTAFILDRSGARYGTRAPASGKVLRFRGLKFILNPAKELTDAVHWAKIGPRTFCPVVELHRLIRENSNDDNEYKRYMDSLKGSVLTAFYTLRR